MRTKEYLSIYTWIRPSSLIHPTIDKRMVRFLTRSITKTVGPVSQTGLASIVVYDTIFIAKLTYKTGILNIESKPHKKPVWEMSHTYIFYVTNT